VLRPTRTMMAVLALLIVPAGLVAQQQMPPAQPQLPPEVQEWIAEIEQIQTRLAPVQEEALQDEAIQAEQEALGAEVEAAMQAVDPELAVLGDRMDQLRSEAQAAQEAGEMERLQGLAQEANQIQQRFQMAQAQALEQPELASKVESFQENLQAKMIEMDPEAEELLDRFEELATRIEAAMDDPSTTG
jgi:chromosome segregation ATPase